MRGCIELDENRAPVEVKPNDLLSVEPVVSVSVDVAMSVVSKGIHWSSAPRPPSDRSFDACQLRTNNMDCSYTIIKRHST